MQFLTQADVTAKLRDSRLQQIIDQDDSIMELAESDAIAMVIDAVNSRYDINADLQKSGTDRSRTLVRWLTYLTIYFLYDRIPDQMVPKRAIKNYNDVLNELERVEDGKKAVTLTRKTNDDDEALTKFRWGSQDARSH